MTDKTESAAPITEMFRLWRATNRWGTRGLAKKNGISHATFARVENGKQMDGRTQLKIINWLFGETHD